MSLFNFLVEAICNAKEPQAEVTETTMATGGRQWKPQRGTETCLQAFLTRQTRADPK